MNPVSIILSIIGFILSLVKGKQNEKPIESAPDSRADEFNRRRRV
jgi:hypothetical protein